jgi:peptidyl-prolyl cis-trans isomerase A (cyclophilin A)
MKGISLNNLPKNLKYVSGSTIRFFAVAFFFSFAMIAWGCQQTEKNDGQPEQTGITDSSNEPSKQVVGETEQGQEEQLEQNNTTGEQTETKGGNPVVIMSTSLGDIKIELYPDKAPITVENFLSYAKDGFYNGTIFHRVIPGFMIQGGGFTPDMQQKPTKSPIKNEADNGLKNEPGTIAMARTSVVDSATSQFFINQVDNQFLNHGSRDFGYAVFGKVVEGMDVVNKIAQVKTGRVGPFQDVPIEPVVVESVKVVEVEKE